MTKMPDLSSRPRELEEMGIAIVRRQFDGIKFLWQIPEIRYLLKLIVALFGFMIIYTSLITILIAIFGLTSPLFGYSVLLLPLFLGSFLFILMELAKFYWSNRKYRRLPERNPLIKTKFKTSIEFKGYKKYFLYIVIILAVILLGGFLFLNIFYRNGHWLWTFYSMYYGLLDTIIEEFFMSFTYIYIGIYFLMGFVTARGTMQSFEKLYVEKFHRHWYWYFIFLPIPWIFLIVISVWIRELYDISHILGGQLGSTWVTAAIYLYMLLCIFGLLAIPRRNWRAGYTTSQIAASYTFLFVILIPVLVGSVIDLIGPVISYAITIFLYIQGNLDGYGDDLRVYYDAFRNRTYGDNTPLDTEVLDIYRNLILGLVLLLLTLFGFFFQISLIFPIFGMEVGIKALETQLELVSLPEIMGITLALFLYVTVIGFRKRTFAAATPK